MQSFFRQLRRRKVLRSLASYLVAAWLVVQVLDVVGPALGLPERVMAFVVVSLAAGFPIVAIVSWFFELTSRGLRRESAEDGVEPPAAGGAFSYVIIAMLAAALGVSLLSRGGGPLLGEPETPALPTLAVLPLAMVGVGSDDGFVEGLHDDLLTVLSRIESLRVISRTSVMPFAGSDRPLPEIGRRLGAGTILEGSVQRTASRIRVNVQLVDASEDRSLWAEIFERPFDADAIFSIQRDIAQTIARSLSIALTGEDEAELQRRPTASSEAYSAYLLGRQRMARRTSDSLAEAERFLRRALDLDPGYADAWAQLAQVIVLQHHYAGLDRETMRVSAMSAVQQALALEPRLSTAHAVLGDLRAVANDMQGAEESFLRAVELNPNDSLATHWYGTMLYGQGRFDEAEVWYRRALELDPLSVTISNSLAQDLLARGREEEAAEQYAISLEIDPEFVPTYAHLAQLQRYVYGRPDEAVRLLYQAYERDPAHSEYPALMAEALLELDAPEAAARWARRATDNAADHWWPSRAAVLVALRSGVDSTLREALARHGAVLSGTWLRLVAERDLHLAANDPAGARRIFLEAKPEFLRNPPSVGEHDYYLAPVLAVVHQASGDHEAARVLLERMLAALAGLREQGFDDFDLSEVEARAMLGAGSEALALLEGHTANGWMPLWWYALAGPNLAALEGVPGFQALAERIRQRMHELRADLEERYLTPPILGVSNA